MNIIIGVDAANEAREKYTVLPLEDMKFKSHPDLPPITAYCLIENVPLDEVPKLQEQIDLHTKFYENYQKPDFNFCQQALEHLKGKWRGEIDTYYEVMEKRIIESKDVKDLKWDPILYK